jgi:hypothetical protein
MNECTLVRIFIFTLLDLAIYHFLPNHGKLISIILVAPCFISLLALGFDPENSKLLELIHVQISEKIADDVIQYSFEVAFGAMAGTISDMLHTDWQNKRKKRKQNLTKNRSKN